MTVINAPRSSAHASPGAPTGLRMAILALAMVTAASSLGWKLYEIQVADPQRYVDYGAQQRVDRDIIPAERGAIVDRNGLILAGSMLRPSVTANPSVVVDPAAAAAALAPVLGEPAAALEQRLRRDSKFAYLSRHVDAEVAEQVAGLGLAGVFLVEEPSRANPGGPDFARSVLGRADIDNVGISGLEKQYDDLLTGEPGDYVHERASNGTLIPSGEQVVVPAVAGDSLVLSLDQTLQFTTEQLLAKQVLVTGAEGGIAIVMDNRSGDVLSMANVERDAESGEVLPSGHNRAVTWAYEPGSIAKPLTFAGVLEADLGSVRQYLEVPWRVTRYDEDFTDTTEHATSPWNMIDILEKSSNVGTILWAEQLGSQGLHDTFEAFGLGQATDLGFLNEGAGTLHDTTDWSGTSLPTISIGQGVAVTPIQMAQAYATLANGGREVAPRLVLGSESVDGTFTPVPAAPTRQVVSEQTAAEVTEMLTAVVDIGTGSNAAIPGYSTAGKTGTAWKPQPGGGYTDAAGLRHYVASFAGFLPADDPQITIVVVIDEPSGSRESGGLAAAPLFAELSRYTLTHLGVPPSTETTVDEQANVRSETLAENAPPVLEVEPIDGAAAVVPDEEAAADAAPAG